MSTDARADLVHHTQVARLRRSFGVTATAPLSEPAQRITNSDADPEKSSEGNVEVHNPEQLVVNMEDEKFEWGEVVRGTVGIASLPLSS